jgi:cobalt/nickel transport system ATP-binding protein
LIKIENISFTYPDGNMALKDISLQIKDNETVGIVGANGAGKSTLLTMMVGINLPDKGKIIINGIEISKETLPQTRKNVGMVFQNPDDQLFMTSVYEDIAFGPRNQSLGDFEIKNRVNNALEKLDISHLKDRAPHKLSGGEKRSVAIASVLSMEPLIMLLDEPSSFLDPCSRRNLINTLNGLGLIKLVATHDLDLVLEICDRVVVLKNGEVFCDGDPNTILKDDELMKSCGLELPLSLSYKRGTEVRNG